MTTFIIILIVILVILYIHHKAYLETFVNLTNLSKSEPLTLLVFVSKSCKHCSDYNNNYHDAIVDLATKKGVVVKRIFSDEDPDNLFEKFKIKYVPTGIVMKKNQIYKNLGSNVNPQSVQSALL